MVRKETGVKIIKFIVPFLMVALILSCCAPGKAGGEQSAEPQASLGNTPGTEYTVSDATDSGASGSDATDLDATDLDATDSNATDSGASGSDATDSDATGSGETVSDTTDSGATDITDAPVENSNAAAVVDNRDDTCDSDENSGVVQGKNDTENVSVNKTDDYDTTGQRWKFRNYAVSAGGVTISNPRFNMKIPAGSVYPKNIEAFVLNCMDRVEKASGFSFYPAGKKYQKINITVEKGGFAYGSENGINLESMDLIIDERDAFYVYAHELSHVLDYRNAGTIYLAPFVEAFAILNAYRAIEIVGAREYFINTMNYSHFDNDAEFLADPENYYLKSEGWDAYLAGFRFGVFLEKTYGSNIFPEIMKRNTELYQKSKQTKPGLISVIKSMTSEKVFDDFTIWYKDNADVFSGIIPEDPADAVKGISEELVMPVLNNFYQGYSMYKYLKEDGLVLDFNDGFALAEYYGYMVNGIVANLYSEGNNTFYFYDPDGNLISSKEISKTAEVSIPGAAKIRIEGDPGLVYISPLWEKMR